MVANGKNNNLSHQILKDRQRAIRDDLPDEFNLRIHRALSWLKRAEKEVDDPAAAFIFYWIGFNAIYASDIRAEATDKGISLKDKKAKQSIQEYFNKIVSLDEDQTIAEVVWQRFPGPIRLLLTNRYTFQPFWDYYNGLGSGIGWEMGLEKANKRMERCFKDNNTEILLFILFDRLYVLRNQILHGGATWDGKVNREQVRSGADIMMALLPIFIDLMMRNPNENWGKPFYPVVERIKT